MRVARWMMARLDDEHVEITVALVGVGRAAVDFLAPRAAKLSIDRETLEQAPVFRFGMRGELWGRSLVVVMSALPLDVLFQADILVALHTDEAGLVQALDRYDLLPIDPGSMSIERLERMGGVRGGEPLRLLFEDASAREPLVLDGWTSAPIDLRTGDGGSLALNPLVARIIDELEQKQRVCERMPCIIHTASHHAEGPDDLSPSGAIPRPGSRLAIEAYLHEPVETDKGDSWSLRYEGRVEAAELHEVSGVIQCADSAPDSLGGSWRVRLERKHEIWMVRSMIR
jgi:hypothetical protein